MSVTNIIRHQGILSKAARFCSAAQHQIRETEEARQLLLLLNQVICHSADALCCLPERDCAELNHRLRYKQLKLKLTERQ